MSIDFICIGMSNFIYHLLIIMYRILNEFQ